jgi:hypothetical protein
VGAKDRSAAHRKAGSSPWRTDNPVRPPESIPRGRHERIRRLTDTNCPSSMAWRYGTTPLRYDATPVCYDATAMRCDTTALRYDTTPIRCDTTPVCYDTTPARCSSPRKRCDYGPCAATQTPALRRRPLRYDAGPCATTQARALRRRPLRCDAGPCATTQTPALRRSPVRCDARPCAGLHRASAAWRTASGNVERLSRDPVEPCNEPLGAKECLPRASLQKRSMK